MYNFNYHKAHKNGNLSAQQCVEFIQNNPDAKFLGGGQSLIPTLKQRLAAPSDLIDIQGLFNEITLNGEILTIGATATHAQVAKNTLVSQAIPALALLAGQIGDRHIRNLGTIGGSLANNDPAACYPAACLGLKSQIQVLGIDGFREIANDDFFQGIFSTCLAESDLITAISFNKPIRAAYQKFMQPASRFALVGVFVAQYADEVRVAITGAGGDGVYRDKNIESALNKNYHADSVPDIRDENLTSDIHASAEYRAHLIKILCQRAIKASFN